MKVFDHQILYPEKREKKGILKFTIIGTKGSETFRFKAIAIPNDDQVIFEGPFVIKFTKEIGIITQVETNLGPILVENYLDIQKGETIFISNIKIRPREYQI